MNWYTWTTQQDFNDWHQTVITGLHLPRVGINQATGQAEPTKQLTLYYTSVTEVAADDWRAPVEDSVATTYATGLGTPCDPPPTPEEPDA